MGHRSAFDAFEEVLHHRIPLKIEGVTKRVTIVEAMLLKLRELALSGNRGAIAMEKKLQLAMPTGPEEQASKMEKWERVRLSVQLRFQRFFERTQAEDAKTQKEAGNEGS